MSGAVELLVEHDTAYTYSSQVAFAQHLAHLRPADARGQAVRDFTLDIEPPPALRHDGLDTFGNTRTYFALTSAHETLLVRTRSRVRLEPAPLPAPAASLPWEQVRAALQYVAGGLFVPAVEFTFRSAYVGRDDALRDYAAASFTPRRPVLEAAVDLMHRIHADFRYAAGATDVATPMLEAFAARAGVCQDFSHVMIGCLRSLGLAARYVSGYLVTRPAPAPGATATRAATAAAADGAVAPAVVGADASHAWVAVYCPRLGWLELDPTNDVVPALGHVRLATGRDYGDVAPLRGVVQGGGEHQLRVAVRVAPAQR